MQIANLIIANQIDQDPADIETLVPNYARKDEAAWHNEVLPEIGRVRATLTKVEANKASPYVKLSLRLVFPTLRTVYEESGFEPAPEVDFANSAELVLRVHPRSTALQRERTFASIITAVNQSSFLGLLNDVVKSGNSVH